MEFITSVETDKLDAALAKAQGEIKPANLDKINAFYGSKYADFSTVLNTVKPSLAKHGISITQWPVDGENPQRAYLITRVSFGGQWMQVRCSTPMKKIDAHGWASGITYLKRITYGAILGVSFDEDDDGNSLVEKESTNGKEKLNQQYNKNTKPDPETTRIAFERIGVSLNELEHFLGKKIGMLDENDRDRLNVFYQDCLQNG